MSKRYNLQDTITKGYWKGQIVKDLIDKNPTVFQQHVNNYPHLYGEEVLQYLREMLTELEWVEYFELLSEREYRRVLHMDNK